MRDVTVWWHRERSDLEVWEVRIAVPRMTMKGVKGVKRMDLDEVRFLG